MNHLTCCLLVLFVVIFACSCCLAAPESALVLNKKPAAVIVLGPKASPVERKAADELVRYVARMSGGALKVVTNPAASGNRIIIGTPATNTLVARVAGRAASGFSESALGSDGYIVRTIRSEGRTDLLLAGRTGRSALYATYHLLSEVLHVGFFWGGEYVPKSASIRVPGLNIVSKPRWPLRQYNQGCVFTYNWMRFWPLDLHKRELEWAAWHRQNRVMWPLGDPTKTGTALDRYRAACGPRIIDYAHRLGIDIIGVDHVYNLDPFPEERVSKDPAEEDRIMGDFARKTMTSFKAKDPKAVWFTSGWAIFNPGWRQETAKAFFGSVGSDDFYVSDCWGEGHPIYRQYDYFYGKAWIFGVLHCFGGNAMMHGHMPDLAKRVNDVALDPRADRCLGVYINPEIIHYNELYFDLAAHLAWDPGNFRMAEYLRGYSVRRYGVKSAPAMARSLEQLVASAYATNDTTPGYYQIRLGESYASVIYDRVRYVPKLNKALEIALGEKKNQKGNTLYVRDLVDVAKQSLAELFNYKAISLYNAFSTGDRKGFEESARTMLEAMDYLTRLLGTHEDFQINAIMKSVRTIPGLAREDLAEAERSLKDETFTFAGRDDLRDYPRRDLLELADTYYAPRVRVYINHLRDRMQKGAGRIDTPALTAEYSKIEKAWLANPLPAVRANKTWDAAVAAVEDALRWMRTQEHALKLEPGATVQNGGFEQGTVQGWRLSATNVAVEVPRDVKPFIGFHSLRFATDRAVDPGDHTFSLSQDVRSKSDSPKIGVHYFLEAFSSQANARLIATGYDKSGNRKYILVYFWGGDSWDHVKAGPAETGGFYAASYKQDSTTGEWRQLEVFPTRDLDKTFGDGTSRGLDIDRIEIQLACWTSPNPGQHISGYFDEVTLTQ